MIKFYILLFALILTQSGFCQFNVTGKNICSDGSNSASIGLSNSASGRFYVLFRGEEPVSFISRREAGPIDFGKMSEPGIYEVVEYVKLESDHPLKNAGVKQNGKIIIEDAPVVLNLKPIEITSGNRVNFTPKTSVAGSKIRWTGKIISGNAEGVSKSGEGNIIDQLTLKSGDEAIAVYTLIPESPLGCTGKTAELKIKIIKSKY